MTALAGALQRCSSLVWLKASRAFATPQRASYRVGSDFQFQRYRPPGLELAEEGLPDAGRAEIIHPSIDQINMIEFTSRIDQRPRPMNPSKLIAIILIVGGLLGLAYGGFSYTKDTTALKLGPIELTVKEQQTVNVPIWAGIGAIVLGGLLLALGGRK